MDTLKKTVRSMVVITSLPRFAATATLCSLLLFISCKSDGPTGPFDELFEGITRTSVDGIILGEEDPDDWKDISEAGFAVHPISPNPAATRSALYYRLEDEIEAMEVIFLDRQLLRQDTFHVDRDYLQPGNHSYTLNLIVHPEDYTKIRPAGIKRIKIRVKTDGRYFETYGDLLYDPD